MRGGIGDSPEGGVFYVSDILGSDCWAVRGGTEINGYRGDSGAKLM